MTNAKSIVSAKAKADAIFKETAFKARIKLLSDEMERAAVACSHGESVVARDILLRAIEFNSTTPIQE